MPDNYEASVFFDKKSVSVTIAADTKFIKTFIFLPTEEELKKTGGWYKADDLKREVSAGTIEDIRPDECSGIFNQGQIVLKICMAGRCLSLRKLAIRSRCINSF